MTIILPVNNDLRLLREPHRYGSILITSSNIFIFDLVIQDYEYICENPLGESLMLYKAISWKLRDDENSIEVKLKLKKWKKHCGLQRFKNLNKMNEAKEKATELGNKFYQGSVSDYDKQGHLDEIVKAKNRTKICVQAILDAIRGKSSNEDWKFWNDVMSEIDGL